MISAHRLYQELDDHYCANQSKIDALTDREVSAALRSNTRDRSLIVGVAIKMLCDDSNINFMSISPSSMKTNGIRINVEAFKKDKLLNARVRSLSHFLTSIDDDE